MSYRFLYVLFLLTSLWACKNSIHTTSIKGDIIPIDKTINGDPEIIAYIQPYALHLNQTLDSVIAYNPNNLSKKDGKLNTALGNLMADLVMVQANPIFKSRTGNSIDIVLLNQGGIRSGIGKGPVTSRTGFELMPFENEIIVVELSGKKIQEMLTYLEVAKTAHPISGMQIRVDSNFKLKNAMIGGKILDINRSYFVATSDYLQQGGDNMNFFKEPLHIYELDYKLRNAIIDHFMKVDTLKTSTDNRFIQIP
tara:strand:+ start:14897 stop:15652 length:756 start_codon:yes stop_codon:yes gene_type:complete